VFWCVIAICTFTSYKQVGGFSLFSPYFPLFTIAIFISIDFHYLINNNYQISFLIAGGYDSTRCPF
jgi:hypothetical protein